MLSARQTRGNSRGRNRRRKANVLVFTLLVVGVLGVLVGGLLTSAVTQRRFTDRYHLYTQEFTVAEYQLDKAFGEISYALKKAGASDPVAVVNGLSPAVVPDYMTIEFSKQLVSDTHSVLPAGDEWASYNLRALNYRISSRVKRSDARGSQYEHPGVKLQQDIQITYVPLYAYGIFYSDTLEMHPSAPFVEAGRVHTNSRLYYGSDGNTLDITNYLTAAGSIFYGRNPDSGLNLTHGTNRFWDGVQLVQAPVQDSRDLDSTWVNWIDQAQSLWKGYVRDRAMGVPPLRLAWPDTVANIQLIQPPAATDTAAMIAQKFCYKAGLFITKSGGTISACDAAGQNVPLSTVINGETVSAVSTAILYNERGSANASDTVGVTVNVLDIDLAKLGRLGIAPNNGIIYVRNTDGGGAVRVSNGADLPGNKTLGLSVITPQPLYVKGDYNTVNSTLSMLAGDAITILSSAWLDVNNDNASKRQNKPVASASTTVNAVCIAGIVPTCEVAPNVKKYSGGVENFFRFMEDWGSNRVFTFTGSIIELFASQYATGFWGTQNYSPPYRVWSWDTRLRTQGPPGAPIVYATSRRGWSIAYQ